MYTCTDDFTTIQRSVSQASEETPPHIYTLPPGFPHSPAQQQLHQRGAGGSHSNNNFTLSCDSNSLSARDGGGGKGSGRGSGEGGGGLFPGLVPELKGSNDAADQASTNSNAAGEYALTFIFLIYAHYL